MASALKKLEKEYSPDEEFNLGWYAGLTVVFNALLLGTLLAKPKPSVNPGPEASAPPIGLKDLALLGVATHKLTRIITKDEVTSFIRAPLTRYQESLGYGEVNEKTRRSGGLEVLGELLTCNYCMSAWVGLGLFWGLSRFPKETRAISSLFSIIALSDFLHVAYEESRTKANVLTLQETKYSEEEKSTAKSHASR